MMLDTTTEERRAARRRRRERLASQDRDVNVRGIVAAGVAAMALLGLSHHLLLPDTADAGSHHLRRPMEQEAPFPRLTRKQRDAFGHHVFVDHTHGLVLCAIPKVGSTELARLILRMGNSSHWRRDPQRSALAVADRDKHLVSKLSLQKAQALVDDRRYTWAVFFRDPAQRLLSAYRNRILGRGENVTFGEFVSRIRLDRKADPHWRPQRYLCNNEMLLERYDFVGQFTRIQADARRLLESLGAWDRYGEKGWGAHKSRASIFAGAQLRAKAASEAFSMHYTPSLLTRVRKMYAMDYALLRKVDAME
ncbi:unnamed protein product [Pelagomonas calceolata]|uniref:Sulfotransferase domain-containing protein n=1 Tax=Pelagomonas calceolata TaxID=35677 RepID=A0A8J2SRH0_9STRA|nr:unnamed protein product [Pelagomonas calceolata]